MKFRLKTEFDETLDILNEKGEEHGLKFKRGNIQYENKKEIYKAIFCRYKERNIKRLKIDKATISDKKDKEEIELKIWNENHNAHPFVVKKTNLNPLMLKENQNYHKNSNISELKAVIEKKFNVNISYINFYYEFRKVFPLLGPKNALFLINCCNQHNFIIKRHINEEEKQYTKLFMCSELMKFHYNYYSDVVIIDSTYRVNKYKLPLVIFTSFTHKGRNCLLGVGILFYYLC